MAEVGFIKRPEYFKENSKVLLYFWQDRRSFENISPVIVRFYIFQHPFASGCSMSGPPLTASSLYNKTAVPSFCFCVKSCTLFMVLKGSHP